MQQNKTYLILAIVALVFILGGIFWLQQSDTDGTSQQRELKILQWKHFVPRYDEWFDSFAREWGKENNVNVIVDHVDIGDLNTRINEEIAAGEGHDLHEHLSPPASFEPDVMDLTDVNEEAQEKFGRQVSVCRKSSFNPTTDRYYGFCHSWTPDPANYRKRLWEIVGRPQGPGTWQELLESGARIKQELGVGMGIGMSNEIDSNMAARALLWSFGASVQNKNEEVVLNSPETAQAVRFMKELYDNTMEDEVFDWGPASNNQALVSGRSSYILNSISAYRTAQKSIERVANDIFFVPPSGGPSGKRVASAHVFGIYVIPRYSDNADVAKEFLLGLVANYDKAVLESELYNFSAFPKQAPELYAEGGWLDNDPYGSNPADKLAPLKNAEDWTVNIGYPGPANAAIGEVFSENIIPKMFARVARGDMTPEESIEKAEAQIKAIFEKWREKGLVSG